MSGDLTIEREQEIVSSTMAWLEERTDDEPVYKEYLSGCCEWANPWKREEQAQATTENEP